MASLYAKYVKEILKIECVETENAFATYEILEDGIYVMDVFVDPRYRRTRIASDLTKRIEKISKDMGYSKIYTSVNPRIAQANISLKTILAYGFQLLNSSPELIMFVKEID